MTATVNYDWMMAPAHPSAVMTVGWHGSCGLCMLLDFESCDFCYSNTSSSSDILP
jgi:hypothetical protein